MKICSHRAIIWVTTWRYGLQFDVQYDLRPDGSFRGSLWTWDYRRPWRLRKEY